MADQGTDEPKLAGSLYKWTNYIKGYQRRWFVLSNGLLSYYRVEPKRSKARLSLRRKRRHPHSSKESQAEARHTCRGSISLQNAEITPSDSLSFTISSRGNQTFHIRAASEMERQTWLTALKLAQESRRPESEDEEEFGELTVDNLETELNQMIKQINKRLDDLKTYKEVINKHWHSLKGYISEVQTVEGGVDANYVKELEERATIFRVTATAMVNKFCDFSEFVQSSGLKWMRLIELQNQQKQRLETMVEQLARQHSYLEQAAQELNSPRQATSTAVTSEDEDEFFFDATSYPERQEDTQWNELQSDLNLCNSQSGILANPCDVSDSSMTDDDENPSGPPIEPPPACPTRNTTGAVRPKGRARRVRVPNKPDYPLQLWSIMKNCIGKELSKIPMPVNFSEPLSMLQRLTEDFEYASILDKAASCSDSCEQLAYVAAFTVSSYATTSVRTAKPFNPLLAETYECDRTEDLGWRAINEQVSHHPPMFAQHTEGKQWKSWQEFTMTSKFRGKYLQVIPLGTSHLTFNGTKNYYTWRKVITSVHNIVVGKLWVDQHGDMDIINHETGDVCHLKYIPYSYFNRDSQRKVKGWVKDGDGQYRWVISGTWDKRIEIAPVLSWSGSPENPTCRTGSYVLAWEVNPVNPGCDKFYNFSVLAAQLNEPEEGVAPTDSRLRPDQRLMEEGLWGEANKEKIRLEEKQRAVRRAREAEAEAALAKGEEPPIYEPYWFRKEKDPVSGEMIHVFAGEYWECKKKQDWSRCPDIF